MLDPHKENNERNAEIQDEARKASMAGMTGQPYYGPDLISYDIARKNRESNEALAKQAGQQLGHAFENHVWFSAYSFLIIPLSMVGFFIFVSIYDGEITLINFIWSIPIGGMAGGIIAIIFDTVLRFLVFIARTFRK